MQSFKRLSKFLGKGPNLLLLWAANDRHINVNAARTRRFGQAGDFQSVQPVADQQRDVAYTVEIGTFNRVQVKMQVIGSMDVIATRIPGVEVDAAQIDNPQERGEVAHDGKIDYPRVRMFDRACVDPVGAGDGRAFLKEKWAAGTIGVTL